MHVAMALLSVAVATMPLARACVCVFSLTSCRLKKKPAGCCVCAEEGQCFTQLCGWTGPQDVRRDSKNRPQRFCSSSTGSPERTVSG